MGNNLYKLSPLAEVDLEKIWLYTFKEWSLEQADKYIHSIMTAIKLLAIGKKCGTQTSIRNGYLKYFVGSHVVYFVKHKSSESIDIIRILHKSMDTEKRL